MLKSMANSGAGDTLYKDAQIRGSSGNEVYLSITGLGPADLGFLTHRSCSKVLLNRMNKETKQSLQCDWNLGDQEEDVQETKLPLT